MLFFHYYISFSNVISLFYLLKFLQIEGIKMTNLKTLISKDIHLENT